MVIKKRYNNKKKNNEINKEKVTQEINRVCGLDKNHQQENYSIERFIVYIKEFDKYNEQGELICRNNECSNKVNSPYKKYCSKKCSMVFLKWYYSNFYWKSIRNNVLKRDNYTCQICGIKLHKKKKFNKDKKNWLECDHIIPKSYYLILGYRFDTLENKVKTILELIHNKNNLRTLCSVCHKKITVEYRKQKSMLKKDI